VRFEQVCAHERVSLAQVFGNVSAVSHPLLGREIGIARDAPPARGGTAQAWTIKKLDVVFERRVVGREVFAGFDPTQGVEFE
jgi:hypothetical protein